MAIKRALISVSDKTGVVEFAKGLHELGVEIISTGGTMKAIADAGIPVKSVSEVTGFPEMMDGRVKTLHPMIHGGILAIRDNPDHVKAMKEHGITGIDLVAVNLYPFRETIAKPDVTRAEAIENIDIGGPSMVLRGSQELQIRHHRCRSVPVQRHSGTHQVRYAHRRIPSGSLQKSLPAYRTL